MFIVFIIIALAVFFIAWRWANGVDDSDHTKKDELFEIKKPQNMLYTINKPLKIEESHNGEWYEFEKVSTEFVSKEIVVELLKALKEANLQIEYLSEKFGNTGTSNSILVRINQAITNAEK